MENEPTRPTVTMVIFYVFAVVCNVLLVSYKLQSPVLDMLTGIGIAMAVYLFGIWLSHRIYTALGQNNVQKDSSSRLIFWFAGCLVFALVAGFSMNAWLATIVLVAVYFLVEFLFVRLTHI
ncbi:MAG TPA: hypothetical protein VF837_01660 [Patescibacteria group bacterium]